MNAAPPAASGQKPSTRRSLRCTCLYRAAAACWTAGSAITASAAGLRVAQWCPRDVRLGAWITVGAVLAITASRFRDRAAGALARHVLARWHADTSKTETASPESGQH